MPGPVEEIALRALGPKKGDGSQDQHLLKVQVTGMSTDGDTKVIVATVDRSPGKERESGRRGMANGPRTVTRLDPTREKKDV